MATTKPMKRPYATHYYSDPAAKEPAFTSQGAAKTDEGAIRATVVRVFMHQYVKALIHDRRTGLLLYTIKLDSGGLRVHYGRAVTEAADNPGLRVVK